ncbi:MAG TPA: hypothetical protein VIN59_03255 [Alphaproteobacteria bacterium]
MDDFDDAVQRASPYKDLDDALYAYFDTLELAARTMINTDNEQLLRTFINGQSSYRTYQVYLPCIMARYQAMPFFNKPDTIDEMQEAVIEIKIDHTNGHQGVFISRNDIPSNYTNRHNYNMTADGQTVDVKDLIKLIEDFVTSEAIRAQTMAGDMKRVQDRMTNLEPAALKTMGQVLRDRSPK